MRLNSIVGIGSLLLLLGASCSPKPPTPTPTPTPPPPNEFPNLVLRRSGPTLTYLDGTKFPFRETIACCVGAEGTGWPDINKVTVDDFIAKGSATVFHFRVGPFSGLNEDEWASIGGGYSPVGNLVDLNTWNDAYWTANVDTCRYINTKGGVCEVLVVDDWILKVQVYGVSSAPKLLHPDLLQGTSSPYPWRKEANIQHEDATSQAPGPRQEQWIRKVVHEFGRLGVVWQLGNEERQVAGYDYKTVTVARAKIVRDQEAIDGYYPHLMSQNSEADEGFSDGATDWTILHSGFPGGPYEGKITSTNEYNPSPPATCNEVASQWCHSNAGGAYVAAWRHEQDDSNWTCTQGRIAAQTCAPYELKGCSISPPTTNSVSCHHFSGTLWDCTPKANGQPIRPEGTIDRYNCELLSMGGSVPSYWLTQVEGTINIRPRPNNPIQFLVSGTGKGLLQCTIPVHGSNNVCGGSTWVTN